jgi:hypothetical protein
VPYHHQSNALQINLKYTPNMTFIYDDLTTEQSDKLLDNITFYNELSQNINLKHFLKSKQLSRLFAPIATFDDANKLQEEEFVAVMEGIAYPLVGLAYSIDKVQFNQDDNTKIDHSKYSLRHA